MDKSDPAVIKSNEQIDRCLLHITDPKIQKLLLSGYRTYSFEPLCPTITLQRERDRTLKYVALYPYTCLHLAHTRVRHRTNKDKDLVISLARYQAARLLKALRKNKTEYDSEAGWVIAYPNTSTNKTNIDSIRNRFSKWRNKAKVIERKEKNKRESAKSIALEADKLLSKPTSSPMRVVGIKVRSKKHLKDIQNNIKRPYRALYLHNLYGKLENPDIISFISRNARSHYESRYLNKNSNKNQRDPNIENIVVFCTKTKELTRFMRTKSNGYLFVQNRGPRIYSIDS